MNLPATIIQTQAGSSYLYQYTYGADHERVKLITTRPDETITSHYLHADNAGRLRYERDARQASSYVHKTHVLWANLIDFMCDSRK